MPLLKAKVNLNTCPPNFTVQSKHSVKVHDLPDRGSTVMGRTVPRNLYHVLGTTHRDNLTWLRLAGGGWSAASQYRVPNFIFICDGHE